MSGVDLYARQLARTAADATTRARVIDTLARSIARGRLPAVSAAPPVVALAAFAALPAGWTDWALTSGADVPLHLAKYSFVGASWAALNATFPGYFTWKATPAHGGNGVDPTANAIDGGRVRFASFAPQLEIGWGDVGSGAQFRLKVDGEYVQAGSFVQSGGGYVRVTWGDGSAANRKLRHYELEGVNTKFLGVRSATLYPPMPWPVEDRLRMLVHGDSMVSTAIDTTAVTAQLHGGTADVVANLCAQPDCWAAGVGGTGWIANLTGTRSRFNERVAIDVVAPAPDVIWEIGGKNDTSAAGMTQAGVQALVEAWLSTVVAALPNVVILMTGPIASKTSENSSATFLQVAAAKAAAAARFPRNVRYLDNLGAAWMTGSGKQGAVTGDGQADWCIGSDGVHPTAEGHVAQGTRLVKAAAAVLAGWR